MDLPLSAGFSIAGDKFLSSQAVHWTNARWVLAPEIPARSAATYSAEALSSRPLVKTTVHRTPLRLFRRHVFVEIPWRSEIALFQQQFGP